MLNCQPCPKQGVCPNKGKPVFGVDVLESTMVLEGDVTTDDLKGITASIAILLGVEDTLIEIRAFDNSKRNGRRVPVTIAFKAFVDSSKKGQVISIMEHDDFSSRLTQEISKHDINAAVTSIGTPEVIVVGDRDVGTVTLVNGAYRVTDCPRGYLLTNDSIPGSCFLCERGTYSINPVEGCTSMNICKPRGCNECPQGAVCSGGLDRDVSNHFRPKSGLWELQTMSVVTGGEMLRYRLSECPEGHTLTRGQGSAYTRDECNVCEFGKLALGPAIYSDTHASRIDTCVECKQLTGVVCRGGMQVSPAEGYWIDPGVTFTDAALSSMFDKKIYSTLFNNRTRSRTSILAGDNVFAYYPLNDDGNKSSITKFGTVLDWQGWGSSAVIRFVDQRHSTVIPTEWVSHRTLKAFRCPWGFCLANFTCRDGHFGRLCGLCEDNYVMTGKGCSLCDLDARGVAITNGLLVFVFTCLYYWLLWTPWIKIGADQGRWVVESIAKSLNKVLTLSSYVLSMIYKRKNRLEQVKFSRFQYVLGYIKTVVSFAQVSSSFLGNFEIPWPHMVQDVLGFMNYFTLDLLNLPSIACIFRHYNYLAKIMIFTLAPLCIVVALAVPTLLAQFLSRNNIAAVDQNTINDLKGAFFFSLLSLMFLIYNAVSTTVLNTFNCVDIGINGNWLKVDILHA